MNAIQEAFGLFQELETGTQMVALDGFDSKLIAVISPSGINLFQSFHEAGETGSVFLPDNCFKGLIKILQEKISDN